MKLLKTLSILIVSLILTSCANIRTSSTTNPSEEWLVKCPKVEGKAPADFGEAMVQLNDLFDLYTECRIKHNSWVDFENKKVK